MIRRCFWWIIWITYLCRQGPYLAEAASFFFREGCGVLIMEYFWNRWRFQALKMDWPIHRGPWMKWYTTTKRRRRRIVAQHHHHYIVYDAIHVHCDFFGLYLSSQAYQCLGTRCGGTRRRVDYDLRLPIQSSPVQPCRVTQIQALVGQQQQQQVLVRIP